MIYLYSSRVLLIFFLATNPPIPFYLKNLLYVPSINKNIVNVNKFANDNNHVCFEFYPSIYFVKS